VRLTANVSSSFNLSIALKYSRCAKKYNKDYKGKYILFVFLFRNYSSLNGFRMNQAEYSCFPHEQEFLIQEGKKFYVVGIEENIMIKNKN